MAIDHLLEFRTNRPRFGELVGALSKRGITLFTGAGLSIPCGMQGWTTFLLELGRSAGIEADIRTLLSRDEYEEAAERAYTALGTNVFEEAMKNAFGPADLAPDRIQGAVRYLPDIARLGEIDFIITTNFDRVLESVFRICGQPFAERILGGRPERIRDAFTSGSRCLLKLHGDALDRIERVLRKDEYVEAYGGSDEHSLDLDKNLPNALSSIFHARSLLFLGCSLRQDRTMSVLKKIAGRAAPFHFAFLEEIESTEVERRTRDQQLLNEHNIKAIWYPKGEHSAVSKFLDYLHRAVAGQRARGLRPVSADFAFDLISVGTLLDRETLSEDDIRTDAAVRPPKLDVALNALYDAARVSPGRHVTISGAPGTGKSAIAAWMDFLLSEQGQVCGYYAGKVFQNQPDLFDKIKQLPRRSVAIIDDVHLVRPHIERLKNERDLNLVLLGRAGIFEEMDRSQKLPPAHRINLTDDDGKAIAADIAQKYYTGSALRDLLRRTQGDLVYTKWMLSGELKDPTLVTNTLVDRAVEELEAILRDGGPNSEELLRLFTILACFRALELPAHDNALIGVFGIQANVIREICDKRRDAKYDQTRREIVLERHPKLGLLFAKATDSVPMNEVIVFEPTCRRLGIDIAAVSDFCFWSLVVGAMIGNGLVSVTDLVDRLIYGGIDSNYEELAAIAADIELSRTAEGRLEDIERRLVLAYAMANGMRRVKGGKSAVTLAMQLRDRLRVTDIPSVPFEEKSFVLYQQAYLEWLNNNIDEASRLFEESARANEAMANAVYAKDEALAAWHHARAAMSRIAVARMIVEESVMACLGNGDVSALASTFDRQAQVLQRSIEYLEFVDSAVPPNTTESEGRSSRGRESSTWLDSRFSTLGG